MAFWKRGGLSQWESLGTVSSVSDHSNQQKETGMFWKGEPPILEEMVDLATRQLIGTHISYAHRSQIPKTCTAYVNSHLACKYIYLSKFLPLLFWQIATIKLIPLICHYNHLIRQKTETRKSIRRTIVSLRIESKRMLHSNQMWWQNSIQMCQQFSSADDCHTMFKTGCSMQCRTMWDASTPNVEFHQSHQHHA